MPIKNNILCNESSLNSNEEMYGTAPRVDVWFLLEYRGHWSTKAFKDSEIPKAVKSFLNKQLKALPNSRLQLIKKHKNTEEHLKFYLAVSDETNPRLYEFELENYEELLSLDIKKILKSKKHTSNEKIFIVCTNGEHDTCCGKFGMPVYLDIAESKYGSRTWETTHIGGHRFASTFVCLPHGLVYGRLRDGKVAEDLMKQYEDGKVHLPGYRGRSCHSNETQAAEYYLRKETGITEISEFLLKNSKKNDEKSLIKFLSQSDHMMHKVKIRQDKSAFKIIKSCGDKSSFISQFRLLDYSAI
ncbi:MAG: hypothetical protein O7C70_06305 [Candidatus Dadabacteria bacterium]|jgi:hypothetical protein|nr:hypothetical protein [Candidatus Dadabacteria bacterium]